MESPDGPLALTSTTWAFTGARHVARDCRLLVDGLRLELYVEIHQEIFAVIPTAARVTQPAFNILLVGQA